MYKLKKFHSLITGNTGNNDDQLQSNYNLCTLDAIHNDCRTRTRLYMQLVVKPQTLKIYIL